MGEKKQFLAAPMLVTDRGRAASARACHPSPCPGGRGRRLVTLMSCRMNWLMMAALSSAFSAWLISRFLPIQAPSGEGRSCGGGLLGHFPQVQLGGEEEEGTQAHQHHNRQLLHPCPLEAGGNAKEGNKHDPVC